MNRYPELKGKCKTCAGCNRLEDIKFIGDDDCKNYIQLLSPRIQKSIKHIHKVLKITGEQIKI